MANVYKLLPEMCAERLIQLAMSPNPIVFSNPQFTDDQYDEFLRWIEKAQEDAGPVKCVMARDVESAQAFAVWCIENDIPEPEIIVRAA